MLDGVASQGCVKLPKLLIREVIAGQKVADGRLQVGERSTLKPCTKYTLYLYLTGHLRRDYSDLELLGGSHLLRSLQKLRRILRVRNDYSVICHWRLTTIRSPKWGVATVCDSGGS